MANKLSKDQRDFIKLFSNGNTEENISLYLNLTESEYNDLYNSVIDQLDI